MANIKVSELPSTTSFNDEDYTMIVQGGETKKITKFDLLQTTSSITYSDFTSETISVNASSNSSLSLDVTLSGYTPIGVIFWDASNNNACISKCSIYGNTCYLRIWNMTASAITTTITARILYLKN